jgi:non-heme chloroperoxidase
VPYVTVGKDNTTDIRLYYEDRGSGPVVILVHGWPLSSRSWEHQVFTLVEDGYRVITYDRRGFGASSQPWNGYDYDTFAADLHELIEHLDLTGVTLIGFSMGGAEVARYVGCYGTERVTRAVFAAAVTPYLYKSTDNPDGGIDEATLTGFHDAIRADRVAFADQLLTNMYTVRGRTDLVSEPLRRYNVAVAAAASPKGTLDCTTAFTKTDFRKDLQAFTIPTLVVHGDSDAVVPFEVSGQRTAEAIDGSKLVLVKDAPHGLTVTHAQTFNAEILAFLRG